MWALIIRMAPHLFENVMENMGKKIPFVSLCWGEGGWGLSANIIARIERILRTRHQTNTYVRVREESVPSAWVLHPNRSAKEPRRRSIFTGGSGNRMTSSISL